jgi:hypothetical protein
VSVSKHQFEKIKKSDDEGMEWYAVMRNGIEVYHCQTEEMAMKWIDERNKK